MKRAILLAIIGSVLYIPLFSTRLGVELSFQPVWSADPAGGPDPGESHTLYPYHSGSLFGFVGDDGRIAFHDRVIDSVAMSASGFINYSTVGISLLLQDSRGSVQNVLDTRGYPQFIGNRLYVISTNRTRLEEWSLDGDRLWTHEFASLITAIDSAAGWTVVGQLDGRMQLFDAEGNIAHEQMFENSKTHIVYGVGISDAADTIAIVHGLGPQNLTLLRNGESGYAEVFSIELDEAFRENRLVYASTEYVHLEARDSILSISISDGVTAHAARLPGRMIDFGSAAELDWFAATGDDTIHLSFTAHSGATFALSAAKSGGIKVIADGSSILVSTDDNIGRIDLVRK